LRISRKQIMPRYDIKKLRSRLHWIQDYANGLSASQIVLKYTGEGATERKFRTAREAALNVGLLIENEDVVGSGFKLDEIIMGRIRSPEIIKVEKPEQRGSSNYTVGKETRQGISADGFEEDEIKTLREIVVKWKKRDLEFTKKNPIAREKAHWIKLNKPLFEMCTLFAQKNNISLDKLMTLALMEYLRTNRISIESSSS